MSRPPTILVVEDSDDDVFFMQRALKIAGTTADVRFLRDGKYALQYLNGEAEFADRSKHPLPGLIFLDLKRPCVSGLEVLAAIRTDSVLKGMRVYVLTSSDEQRDRENAAALGIDGYLLKPARPAALVPILAGVSDGRLDEVGHRAAN
jgi:CheY-like chemotaxis protein